MMNIYNFIGTEQEKNIKFIEDICATFNNIKFHKNFMERTLEVIEFCVKRRIIHVIQIEETLAIKAEIATSSEDFMKITQSTDWISYFYNEYPILKDYFICEYEKIRNNIFSVIKSLSEDYSLLKLDDNISLMSIDIGEGDFHDNYSTTKVVFDSSLTLYYKPRSLTIDNYILNYLFDLEEELKRKMFYRVINIERKGYGWSWHIPVEDCKALNQVEDYYYNMGILTAVSYFLNIEDLIYDNIISTNGKIALIDLECSFCMERPFNPNMEFVTNSIAGVIFRNSVINSGIIPRHTFGDFYTFGDSDASLNLLLERNFFQNNVIIEKDSMRITMSKISISSDEKHIPKLNGEYQTIEKFYPQYLEGFKRGFFYLHNNKNRLYELLDIAAALRLETRVLYRPTKVYDILFSEYFNRALLLNDKDSNILASLANGKYFGVNEKIIESEIKQIKNFNIPGFKKIVGFNNVYDFSNNSLNVEYHKLSDVDFIKKKIRQIDNNSYSQQLDIILKSFKIFEIVNDQKFNKLIHFSKNNNVFESSLTGIVGSIKESLFITDSEVSCIDIFSNVTSDWDFGGCGPGFGNGLDGIAYLFGLYGFFFKNEEYLNISKIILQNNYKNFSKHIDDSVFFDIIGHVLFSPFQYPTSIIYVNEVLHEVIGEYFISQNELFSKYKKFINKYLQKDEYLDFLIGVSGAIFLFYQLYVKTNNNEYLMIFKEISEHLYDNLTFNGDFAYIDVVKIKKLGGFSHGTSSLTVSLLLAYKLLKDEKYLTAANMALKYDQSLYDKDNLGYLDVRYLPIKSFSHSWAHGTGGIALSRLLIEDIMNNNDMLNDEISICRKILHSSITSNITDYTINGGFAGNMEILKALNNRSNINNDYIDTIFENYLCYIQNHQESLVTTRGHIHLFINQGIAGLAYSILRHLYPTIIPSFLILGIDNKFGSKYLYS